MNRQVNGTLIWYYCICHREVWLIAHQINPDEDHEHLVLGRFIHENTYLKDKHEIAIGNIKVDLIKGDKGSYVVGEIKKSRRSEKSARLQLLYYLYVLKNDYGIVTKGVLLFPEEKRREEVMLDEKNELEVKKAIEEIEKIIVLEKPPACNKVFWCKQCAYAEFCWA